MKNLTIGQVTKDLDITPRMLRHYEKIGLISSERQTDRSVRVYDNNTVRRIQQIIILRKLRISLKDISVILNSGGYSDTLEIFRRSAEELDGEINALDTIRRIIKGLHDRLENNPIPSAWYDLLEDKELVKLSETLYHSKNNLREEHLIQ